MAENVNEQPAARRLPVGADVEPSSEGMMIGEWPLWWFILGVFVILILIVASCAGLGAIFSVAAGHPITDFLSSTPVPKP